MEFLNDQPPRMSKADCTKNGLACCKPLNANRDRPLMQIDQTNQWSDYADIPNGKPVKDQTVLIGSDE